MDSHRDSLLLSEVLSRLDTLEERIERLTPTVEDTLKRRGIKLIRHSSRDGVAFPRGVAEDILSRFYDALKSYHFRRILSDSAEIKEISPSDYLLFENKWGKEAAKKYFRRLVQWGILAHHAGESPESASYSFNYPGINNFGDTLEWFVAEVFKREFRSPAIYGARLSDCRDGGDFDVLVRLEWSLGYIECKSSPPYNIRLDEQREFLRRVDELGPDFSILLVDTTLDIKRNILDNMRHLLGRGEKVEYLEGGVYKTLSHLYIISSKRGLVHNISICLRDLHRSRR